VNEIIDAAKGFIMEKCLPGVDASNIDESTPLITGGILDSISALQLAWFLEKRFGVKIVAHDVNAENFDTLDAIAAFVGSRQTQ
jgi:acyl carrier protein